MNSHRVAPPHVEFLSTDPRQGQFRSYHGTGWLKINEATLAESLLSMLTTPCPSDTKPLHSPVVCYPTSDIMLSKTESGPRHCSVRLVPLLWLITLCFCLADLNPRQSCGQGYHLCSPAGASFRDIPEVGPGLAKLYLNLIATINPQPAPARVFGRSQIADGGLATDGLDSAGLFCFAKGEQDDALTTYCSDNGYWCSDLEGGVFSDAVYYTDDNISACDKNCKCAQRLREHTAQSKVARGVSFPAHRVRETPGNLCCKSSVRCGNMQGRLTQHRRRYHGLYAFAQL
jgi:hypothetical protein